MPEKEQDQFGQGFQSLKNGSKDPKAVESYYDDWAVDYDKTLDEWDYRAATDAATTLTAVVPPGGAVLDVGCGTGLLGKALAARLDCRMDGLDISETSLAQAEKQGVYRRLQRHDLQVTPLPVDDNSFDAAACVGVMTYIDDAQTLLADMCRTVKPGGHILFTHRNDRWDEEDFDGIIKRLEEGGLWEPLQISEPRPYLPGNEEFADNILVIHVLCRRSLLD